MNIFSTIDLKEFTDTELHCMVTGLKNIEKTTDKAEHYFSEKHGLPLSLPDEFTSFRARFFRNNLKH